MKRLSFLFKMAASAVCLFLFAFCSGSKESENITFDMVKAVEDAQSVNLSEYVQSVEYIPLELKDSAFLFSGMKFLATENSYVFYSGNKSVNVAFYEFDKEGKYMRSVGSKGRAKGEFVTNKDVCYNDVTKDYALLDQSKLIIYNPDGSCKNETTVFKFRSMGLPKLYCENGIYYINAIVVESMAGMLKGEMKDVIIKLDSYGNILEEKVLSDVPTQVVPGPPGRPGISGNGLVLYTNGDIFRIYRERQTDTIKCVDPESFEAVNLYMLSGTEQGVFMQRSSFMENENMIFMHLMKNVKLFPDVDENNKMNCAFYDKKKGVFKAIANSGAYAVKGFENDVDAGGFPFWPSYIRGDKMYQLIGADEFVELAEACGSAKVKEIAAGLTPESNPVLVVATLK